MENTLLSKYGTGGFPVQPGSKQAQPPEAGEQSVLDKAKDTVSKLNPLNLVDKAGNFALRAVVVIVATGLIMLGFYFMFEGNLKDVVKAVTK